MNRRVVLEMVYNQDKVQSRRGTEAHKICSLLCTCEPLSLCTKNMNIKQALQEQIKLAVKELDLEINEVELTHPEIASQGDYATNVALIAAKQAGKNPRELAEAIVSKLKDKSEELKDLDRVEVAGPGFINFYLKQEYFLHIPAHQQEADKTGDLAGKKVMIEFTDPNPFKEFHIGHLYSNAVGEAISRLLEVMGAEVKRVNYQGDVGLHVAKAVWGLGEKLKAEGVSLEDVERKPLEERAKYLGEAYALGAAAYIEDKTAKQEIVDINKIVYEISFVILEGESRPIGSHTWDSIAYSAKQNSLQDDIATLYKVGRKWSLEYFETIYKRLGTKFDHYYFESQAGPVGLELVKEYLKKGVFIESDGAVIFPGERYAVPAGRQGLHNRVFINSLGLPTYEAKELGLAPTKYKDFPYDISLIITGNEIDAYFQVLLQALEQIKPELAAKTTHLSHGMVRLPEGKMSSRTGNVLTGEWLLDEAKRRLERAYHDMDSATLDMVSVAAVKWALLRSSIGKDVSFSFEQSISLEGDSGPYIQYTYARTQSVLGKAKSEERHKGTHISEVTLKAKNDLKLENEEMLLLKVLARFAEVVEEAATNYSPHVLTTYLFDLAQAFNLFYQKQRILQAEGEQKNFRLALTERTGGVLKQGLYLLGIKAPEKM